MKLLHFKGFHIVCDYLVMILTFNVAAAVTIFPFVFYTNKYIKMNQTARNEESIHIMQQMECGLAGLVVYLPIGIISDSWLIGLPALLFYYILYVFFYIINLFRFGKRAYEEIPFEREAKRNANRSVYLGLRKSFSWIRYIG